MSAGADPGYGSGGQKSFDPPLGALSPKFAQNRGFPLKLPENCMIIKTSWGQGGPGPQDPLDPPLGQIPVRLG